jgi:hypothetical protein
MLVHIFHYLSRGTVAMLVAAVAVALVMLLTGAMMLWPVPVIALGALSLAIAKVWR